MKALLVGLICVAVASADLAPLLTSDDRPIPNSWIVKITGFEVMDRVAHEIANRFRRVRLPSPRVTKIRCVLPVLILRIPARLMNDSGSTGGGVVSMSLGWSRSETINTAVREMVAAGFVVSIAAGNSNIDACKVSPAMVDEVITVGAVDNKDKLAHFSNHGSCLDIFAPGVDILSSTCSDYSFSATKTKSGTSMACPHVTGAVALYLGQNRGASPADVKTALLNDATSDVIPDTKGSPNKLLYVSYQ
ncbi:uncharacterized protein LOC110988657 [Acanthaster planci]|uniref:Uncharacterized protein LOC110988657 n=1 Tax=Acanthaster planci TaxID=133434 RepID=A0A8B7ZSQ4_ACAPL|nr:uncharacterized protein LOC110988657 [Acanthaster planci]